MSLPEWPEKDPIFHAPGLVDIGGHEYESCPVCHAYERARADAAMARLRVAVDGLEETLYDLIDSGKGGRAQEIAELIRAIGELPKVDE